MDRAFFADITLGSTDYSTKAATVLVQNGMAYFHIAGFRGLTSRKLGSPPRN